MRLPTGLPHLEGARGRAVGIVFIALTTLAVLLAIGGTIFNGIDQFRNIPVETSYGFRTETSNQGGSAIWYVSATASKAGLKEGDRVVAIDGFPVSATATENEIGPRMARAGRIAILVVRTGNGPARRVDLHQTPGSLWTATNPITGMPVWLTAILNFSNMAGAGWVLLAAALLLFLRRPHDAGAMAFAFTFTLLAINPDSAIWLGNYHVSAALIYSLAEAFFVSGCCLFAVAIAAFPDGRFRALPTRVAPFLVLPSLILEWALVVLNANSASLPGWLTSLPGLARPLVVISVLLGIAAQVVRYRRDPLTMVERQQFKWVVLGLAVAAIAILLSELLNYVGGEESHIAVVSGSTSVASLIWRVAPPLGVLVSLLRYRLYDAESAISRSVAYGALTLALLAIFAGSERIIELMGEEYFGHSIGLLAGGLGAGIAAVMIAPIHHRVSEWAERRFQKDLLDLRHGLPLVMTDMRETGSVDQLADAVLKRAEKGVRAVHGAIVVDGELLCARDVPAEAVTAWMAGWVPADTEHLDCAKGDPLFPMRVPLAADGIGTVGWLLLGPRPDGSFYGKDEREALAEIAAPVARAISVARQRAAWRADQAAITTGLAKRIGRLETMITTLAGDDRLSAAE